VKVERGSKGDNYLATKHTSTRTIQKFIRVNFVLFVTSFVVIDCFYLPAAYCAAFPGGGIGATKQRGFYAMKLMRPLP
jgi:hypothetical protein